jgi:hypothetical protein
MAHSSVSTTTTAIEAQIDDRQEMRQHQKRLEEAKTRADTKLQFAALLGEIAGALDPDGFRKRVAFEAMESMDADELEAWLTEAEDDWDEMDRENNFDAWQLLGTLIHHANQLLYGNGPYNKEESPGMVTCSEGDVEVGTQRKGTGYGWPYHVTATPDGPSARPTRSRAGAQAPA